MRQLGLSLVELIVAIAISLSIRAAQLRATDRRSGVLCQPIMHAFARPQNKIEEVRIPIHHAEIAKWLRYGIRPWAAIRRAEDVVHLKPMCKDSVRAHFAGEQIAR